MYDKEETLGKWKGSSGNANNATYIYVRRAGIRRLQSLLPNPPRVPQRQFAGGPAIGHFESNATTREAPGPAARGANGERGHVEWVPKSIMGLDRIIISATLFTFLQLNCHGSLA